MNKVYGGTVQHSDTSLCGKCRLGHVVRSLPDSSERTFCRSFQEPRMMIQPVVNCNMYDDKTKPSMYSMEQIAWVLVTNKAGRAIGFKSPRDRDFGQVACPPTPGFARTDE